MKSTFDFTALSPAQRILLAQDLWDSVPEQDLPCHATSEQQAEIERRAALVDAGQMSTFTWPQMKARLLDRR